MACSPMGHHVEEQYQCKSSLHHLAALRQGYKYDSTTDGLLSPTLFNILIEQIMSDALEEHDGKVSISSRNINQSAVC